MKIPLFLATLAISAASMAVNVSAVAADAPTKISGGALVAANGMTLYTFDTDKPGSGKSACNGPCAGPWPPLMEAADQPLGDYSVVTRDDGAASWPTKASPCIFTRLTRKRATAPATTSRTSGTSSRNDG